MLLTNLPTFFALIISDIMCITLFTLTFRKIYKNHLRTCFLLLNGSMIICCTGLILQCCLSKPLNINPIYFDYFVYIGNVILPLAFFMTGLAFNQNNIKFKKVYLLFFIIPIVSLLALWTNNYHHLFYKKYSVNLSTNEYGILFIPFELHTLGLCLAGIILILKKSIQKSGFFSRQALLIVLAALIPIVQNILSITKVFSASIYITPICFNITILLFYLAIFKFNFLGSIAITMQKIVDKISDGFFVVNLDYTITSFNKTFLDMFNISAKELNDVNLFDLIKEKKPFPIKESVLKETLNKVTSSDKTFHFRKDFKKKNKNFIIELNNIRDNNHKFLGILILFKDITQHVLDMQALKDNQDILIERERLASLGQLIGGIAHNLKSPIMSISGATEGLIDLIKEYEESIVDKDVTIDDHLAIASDMKDWISKIKSYLEYMSDIITAVKDQAVALYENTVDSFTVEELTKRVDILMKHELKKALITLNLDLKVPTSLMIHGNINGLVQVINNMISNAIQAYKGKEGQTIDLIITQEKNDVIVSVRDYAGGLPKEVQEKLFKEMITTKGKDGTGIGLFMSYSNIRAHFNGDITYSTEEGKGTIFNIILPQ